MVSYCLDKKLVRDLKGNWRMLAAICTIISIGAGCFIGMMSASRDLTLARDQYYAESRLAHVWVDLKKAPVREVERLAGIPGIQELQCKIRFRVMLDLPLKGAVPGSQPDSLPGPDRPAPVERPRGYRPTSALLVSMPDLPEPGINSIQIRSGAYFTSDAPNEVIVAEKFANARGIRPGHVLTAVLNNRERRLKVVGTAISPEFIYHASPGSMVDDPGTFGLIFIKQRFAEDVFGFSSACNSVVAILAPGARARAGDIAAELGKALSCFGVFSAQPRSERFSPMIMAGELAQLQAMALTLPVFFLGVAALMLNILMQRIAQQQRTAIGTLKALGYGNGPLMAHFFKFGAVAGLAGGMAGAGLGIWLAQTMTRLYRLYFSLPDLYARIYPDLILAGIFICLAFTLAGTLKGARQVMGLAPAEAMRSASPPAGTKIFLETFTWFWQRLSAQWQMIIRGLVRHRNRSILAMIASALGAAIVLLAFGFVDSMDQMVHLQFHKALKADYHLSFSTEMPMDAVDEIRRLPGVTAAEPVFHLACTFINGHRVQKGSVSGIPARSGLSCPLDSQGRAVDLPDTGLLMSRRLMDRLGLSSGDPVTLIPVKGDQTPRQVVVSQAISSMMGLAVFGEFAWLNQVLGQARVVNEIRVTVRHAPELTSGFMERIRAMPGLETLSDLGEQKAALEKQLNGAMRISALVMIGFAGAIFFGAILNNTLVAMSERQRETATFRTLGYYESEVAGIFLKENLVTGILGTLAGLPLGSAMLDASMKNFATDAFSFPAHLRWASYAYTLGLAILFIVITQAVVRRILGRQNWIQALSLKE